MKKNHSSLSVLLLLLVLSAPLCGCSSSDSPSTVPAENSVGAEEGNRSSSSEMNAPDSATSAAAADVASVSGEDPADNSVPAETAPVETAEICDPVFSRESGFYSEPFLLELSADPGMIIFYTTDGSDPDTTDLSGSGATLIYDGGIYIEDPSGNENVYSANKEILGKDYYIPPDPVDKAVVIRAAAADPESGADGKTVTAVYFIGYENRPAYDNMSVISVTTDPANLFDFNSGIYTSGAGYAQYKERGGFQDLPNDEVPDSYTDENGITYNRYDSYNSSNGGKEWERPADVSLFDEDHDLLFSGQVGLRIAGESTRGALQKSFNLHAQDNSGTSITFPCSFFNDSYESKIRLRRTGNEPAFLEDFLQAVSAESGIMTQDSLPCALFLDGEYWGLYFIAEQYTLSDIAAAAGVNAESLVILKNGTPEAGDSQDADTLESIRDFIQCGELSDPDVFRALDSLVDVDNLISFYCVELYLDNTDISATHNQMQWKYAGSPTDNPLSDGRWRWLCYDLDQSCDDASDNTMEIWKDIDDRLFLVQYLAANSDFRRNFCLTMMNDANILYSAERMDRALDEWSEKCGGQAVLSGLRFRSADYSEEDFNAEVDRLRTFFAERRSYMEEQLRDILGLSGKIAKITVKTGASGGGTVSVNGASLNMEYSPWTGPSGELIEWTGEYFTDYDLSLSAEPLPGYHFAGWTCSSPLLSEINTGDAVPSCDSFSENIALRLSESDIDCADAIVLTATFEKD